MYISLADEGQKLIGFTQIARELAQVGENKDISRSTAPPQKVAFKLGIA